ncbi:hypothetical protein EAI_02180 [Harpegnathos saltator]|uniref:Uncharacterized protein n=1 Tax=Harpegnathos saltator TaxID=610380 RepID=E2BLN6_HARSA|nr:hypothetical protein EAI_02180 [Harpegnathos saltator]
MVGYAYIVIIADIMKFISPSPPRAARSRYPTRTIQHQQAVFLFPSRNSSLWHNKRFLRFKRKIPITSTIDEYYLEAQQRKERRKTIRVKRRQTERKDDPEQFLVLNVPYFLTNSKF